MNSALVNPSRSGDIAGGNKQVLTIETLAQRAEPLDSLRAAAILGGGSWLLRVWKRIAARGPAVSWTVRRAVDAATRLPRMMYARVNLSGARAGVFRSVSMAFRF